MSRIVRSTIPSDLSESDYVKCNTTFNRFDEMLSFIRFMLPYRNIIDYTTYGKLICSMRIEHIPTKVNNELTYINKYHYENDRMYIEQDNKQITKKYIIYDESVLYNRLDNKSINGYSVIYNTLTHSIHIITNAFLIIVDNKNKCKQIKIPKQLYNMINAFVTYNDKDFMNTGLYDVNIGNLVYICDISYNRLNNKIYDSVLNVETDVPIDLKPFFSKTKPSSTVIPEYNKYDQTSYKYINDNLEMIKKDLQITIIDDYKPFDQKRYDSIQYISFKENDHNEKLIMKRKQLIAKLKDIDNELGNEYDISD